MSTDTTQRTRSRSRSRSRERKTNTNKPNEREILKAQDIATIKKRNKHTKQNKSNTIQSLDSDNENEETATLLTVTDLSQSFANSIEPFASLHTATPYSMNALMPSHCDGTIQYKVHLDLKSVKNTFRKIKKAGLYEEVPGAISIDGIRIGVRVYPNGVNASGYSSSGVSFRCMNRAAIFQRIKGSSARGYKIACNISYAGRSFPLQFTLSDFVDSDDVYKEIATRHDNWSRHSNMLFQFTVKKTKWTKSSVGNINMNMNIYKLGFKHGSLKIYSFLDDFHFSHQIQIRQFDENTNTNNTNTNLATKDKSKYLCASPINVAAIGGPFEFTLYGGFRHGNADELWINFPLEQMNCIIFYTLTKVVHSKTDCILLHAVGKYVCNDEIQAAALDCMNNSLSMANIVRFAEYFDHIQVSNSDGLDNMAGWITDNLCELTEVDKETNRSIWDDLKGFKYVINAVNSMGSKRRGKR